MSLLEEMFNDCGKGADKVDKATAYEILCCAGHNPTSLDLAHFWKENGKSDEDLVTLDEIKKLAENLGDPQEVMRKAFKHFDRNGDNKIDREELREILKSTDMYGCEVHLDDDYIDDTLRLGDKNGDGMLDIDELIRMINSNLLST